MQNIIGILNMIYRVENSMDVLSTNGDIVLGQPANVILGSLERTNRLRFIRSEHKDHLTNSTNDKIIEEFAENGNMATVQDNRTFSCVILDGLKAVISIQRSENDVQIGLVDATNLTALSNVKNHFEKLWDNSKLEVVYETGAKLASPISKQVIVESRQRWDDILRELNSDPQKLFDLPPRQFEELTAELLDRRGIRVQLTPESKDGGKDILAFLDTPLGEQLYLVECKRYAADNPVGVAFVRALYGMVEKENATGGIIVTTSRFTKGAMEFQDDLNYKLSLKDYGDLTQWIHEETVPPLILPPFGE